MHVQVAWAKSPIANHFISNNISKFQNVVFANCLVFGLSLLQLLRSDRMSIVNMFSFGVDVLELQLFFNIRNNARASTSSLGQITNGKPLYIQSYFKRGFANCLVFGLSWSELHLLVHAPILHVFFFARTCFIIFSVTVRNPLHCLPMYGSCQYHPLSLREKN